MTPKQVCARIAVRGRGVGCWWRHASTRHSFLVLGAVAATLLAAQGIVLFPLVVADPQMAGLENDKLAHTFWILRGATIAMAPVILALRAASFSTLLYGLLALWGACTNWHAVFRGVLRAEGIFLVESTCATALLIWHAPGTLLEAESVELRAGLDLLWQPSSANLAALLVAANLFALLWTLEIRTILRRTVHLTSVSANCLAFLFGGLVVALRVMAIRS